MVYLRANRRNTNHTMVYPAAKHPNSVRIPYHRAIAPICPALLYVAQLRLLRWAPPVIKSTMGKGADKLKWLDLFKLLMNDVEV